MSPAGPAGVDLANAGGGTGASAGSGAAPAAVEVRALGWTIGGAEILADISLTVSAGEFLAVIGPNGAGKSTLVNMISGVARPSTGRILFGGRDVTGLPVRARAKAGMGRTFQTSSLFNGLTCAQNVGFALQSKQRSPLSPFRRAESAELRTDTAELLTAVGLSRRSASTTASLSHGDKRKLELAVAMARRPEVLLLDEPMAGVSMEDVDSLVELIRALHRRGITIVMVEHHMHVVLGLADRIAVLHHGRLLAVGSPATVTADPAVRQAYLGDAR